MSGYTISDKIAYPAIQALLARVNALRNQGRIDQAIYEVGIFNSAFEYGINGSLIAASIGTTVAATINNSPIPPVVGAGTFVALNQRDRVGNVPPFPTPVVAYIGMIFGNVIYSAGAMAVAAANLSKIESDKHFLQVLTSLAPGLGVVALGPILDEISKETRAMILALEIERDGIQAIAEYIAADPRRNAQLKLAYTSLKNYGNKNTASLLMLLHAKFGNWGAVTAMLPTTELPDTTAINDEITLEIMAAAQKKWGIVKKILDKRGANNPLSTEQFNGLLLHATMESKNFRAIELLLNYAPVVSDKLGAPISRDLLTILVIRDILRTGEAEGISNDILFKINNIARPELNKYFENATKLKIMIKNIIDDKSQINPYADIFQEQKTLIEAELKLDLAKMVFLKILKNLSIPNPQNSSQQMHYKQIFRQKFKKPFYDLMQTKSIPGLLSNQNNIYEAAQGMKNLDIKIDDIDFVAILSKIEKPKLKPRG